MSRDQSWIIRELPYPKKGRYFTYVHHWGSLRGAKIKATRWKEREGTTMVIWSCNGNLEKIVAYKSPALGWVEVSDNCEYSHLNELGIDTAWYRAYTVQ